jgi:hypothetical protein
MFTQEEMYYRIMNLVPDAKFSLRLYSEDAVLSCINPMQIDEWLVDWLPENIAQCPTLDQLINIPGFDLQVIKDAEELAGLTLYLKTNFAFVAAYDLAKKTNPTLLFQDYVMYVKGVLGNLI